jgi:predicted DNA-binding transcriptional regulator AlpA
MKNISADRGEKLLTSKDVSKMLAISERQVFALKSTGQLPFIKIGGSTRYDPVDINAYLETNRSRTT